MSSVIRAVCLTCPSGSRSTTAAAINPCPSRNTVALTWNDSPTTALARYCPQSTVGCTSRMGIRPITPITLPIPCPSTPPPFPDASAVLRLSPSFPQPHLGRGVPGQVRTYSALRPVLDRERTYPACELPDYETARDARSIAAGRLWSIYRESNPPIHCPRHVARAAGATTRPDAEPSLVLARADGQAVRRDRLPRLGVEQRRPHRDAQCRAEGADPRARRRPGFPQPSPASESGPGRIPHRHSLVQRQPEGDRVLLAGVRHHRGAPAVLRRSGHPGRRPPEERQRPWRPADRRRPVLPARLLHAEPHRGRLAGGTLPGRGSQRSPARTAPRPPDK